MNTIRQTKKSEGLDKERRTSQRVKIEMWVEETSARELYFQRSANISVGGVFLDRTIPHPLGTVVNLQFTLPDDSHPVRVKGVTVNIGETSQDLGMGIRFTDLSEHDRQRLVTYIDQVLTKNT